jgi:hypothetical protein
VGSDPQVFRDSVTFGDSVTSGGLTPVHQRTRGQPSAVGSWWGSRHWARRIGAALSAIGLVGCLAGAVLLVAVAAAAQAAAGAEFCATIRAPLTRQRCATALTNPSTLLAASSTGPGGTEKIQSYSSMIQIEHDGSLLVEEAIRYDFGSVARHGIFRDIPDRINYPQEDATDRVYPITVRSVRASDGASARYTTSNYNRDGVGYLRIKVGDPNATVSGTHVYTIVYRVKGVLNGLPDHDELGWNVVGGQWPVPIQGVTVTVASPTNILAINCSQGQVGSSDPCDSKTLNGNVAAFTQAGLPPKAALTVTAALPKGAVSPPHAILEARSTWARDFAATWATVPLAGILLVLFVVGFVWYARRNTRDRRYRGSAVDHAFGTPDGADEPVPLLHREETPVQFVPPEGIRPGEIGTLVQFHAHPLDVTATIIDLAVRGYLQIAEVTASDRSTHQDWMLTKLKDPDDRLKSYERTLHQALFRDTNTRSDRPGWRSDPTGRFDYRYWDGSEWSDYVSRQGSMETDSLTEQPASGSSAPAESVQLSGLRDHFADSMGHVEHDLELDAREQGWFRKSPQGASRTMRWTGVSLFIASFFLTGFLGTYGLGLLGVPFLVLGILVFIGARWAPARTAKGTAALTRVNGFRRFIVESEKDRARFAERKNLFSEYLPYAIVFGVTDKWAKAFAGLDGVPPDVSAWYVATAPFNVEVFATTMSSFTATATGVAAAAVATTVAGDLVGIAAGLAGAGGGGGGSW